MISEPADIVLYCQCNEPGRENWQVSSQTEFEGNATFCSHTSEGPNTQLYHSGIDDNAVLSNRK